MYLLEILILSSDSKEVIYIRRPCVWICTICMFLLVWFHATHMQEQWQKNYPYEALLAKNNDKINAYVKGIYYRTEPTDSSNRLYLKKVSVHISGQKVYNFSNMIVYSDQTSSLLPGNTIECFGTLKNFAAGIQSWRIWSKTILSGTKLLLSIIRWPDRSGVRPLTYCLQNWWKSDIDYQLR